MKGLTLVELLIGMVLGLVAAAAMTALVRVGVAAWERAGADSERALELAAAVDQLARDVRIAGYDPTDAGLGALTVTAHDRLEITADLDGDGTIDPNSEERIGYRVAPSSRSLQRMVGAQTLPILADVTAFALAYFDANGVLLDPGDSTTAAATRLVTVGVTTSKPGRHPLRVDGGARLVNR
jgi:type IV pilus assembly protein PilW